jgi:hypothetical protein
LCPDCELCKQAQHRRCTSCFGSKYLSGDALKAKCGAPIMVEIINPRTGDVVSTDKMSDIQLEVGHATLNCIAARSFCLKLVHHSTASIFGSWLPCSTTASFSHCFCDSNSLGSLSLLCSTLISAARPWAARYITWLLMKLTPKGVVVSFLFFSAARENLTLS